MNTTLLRYTFIAAMATVSLAAGAQYYDFETIVDIPTTSVKNQSSSGTCWSFSAVSFFESEMMRMGKDSIDLSEMFIVNRCYAAKGEWAVRLHGMCNFGAGGEAHDATWVMKNYGMMPEEAYHGINYGFEKHNHMELDTVLSAFVKAVVSRPKLTTAWRPAYNAIIDTYLGAVPETFTYKGVKYTPRSFADEVVGLNPDDYVSLTSFTHHPFYEEFVLEVPDNWLMGKMYNVTLDELVEAADYALKHGYSLIWGADVSEQGFSHYDGVAVIPDTEPENMTESERARWEKLDYYDRQEYGLSEPVTEKVITQEMRQLAFDNYETTDDHGMHIVGMAKDQNGTIYYKVKNSWSTDNYYDGYIYASLAFYKYKTMDIMLHKDALPPALKAKLNIK